MAFALLSYHGSCSSYVGRTGRRQDIILDRGCWSRGIVAHEIGECRKTWTTLSKTVKIICLEHEA